MLRPEDIDRVYRSHGHVVWRRARALLDDDDEAHDVVHDVFRRLVEDPTLFRGASALSTFVYAMTTRIALRRVRDRATHRRLDEQRAPAPASPGQARPDRLATLRGILSRLPDELAEVAVYYYVDEMTHQEIAVVLGCSRRRIGDLLVRFHDLARSLCAEPSPLQKVS